jgi:Holliday junction resolvase
MSTSTQVQHDAFMNAVAERYRSAGYMVTSEPGSTALPFDLGAYRPDLIARKGDFTTIVEVKTHAQKTSFDQLRAVAEEVKRHKGWRFVLVTDEDVLASALPAEDEDGDEFSWKEISYRLEEAQRLVNLGENEAAYLILWIAFERIMRFHARRVALPVDRLAPSILIRQLYSQGELSLAQFDTAISCQEVRNRIVHGFRASGLRDAVARLGTVVRELLEQWSAPSCRE